MNSQFGFKVVLYYSFVVYSSLLVV